MPQYGNVHDLFFKQSLSEPGVAADFVRRSEEEVTGDPLLRFPLLILRVIFRGDLPAQFVRIAGLLRHHPARALVQALLLRLLSYVAQASDSGMRSFRWTKS